MERGRSFSLTIALGILAGSAAWGLAAALGVSAIMMANAWMFEVLRYFGAGYLLFLAVKSARQAINPKPAAQERSISGGHRRVFVKGVLLHLTNPKAILSWGAVYAIALPANAAAIETLSVFAFLYSGSIIVFLGYAVLFSGYKRARRWFDACFAAFFGAVSLKILTADLVP